MLLVFFLLFLKVVLSDLQFSQGVVFFLLSCQHLTAVCMHIFSFTYTFSWHMHAHLHRHTCLSHARTHTRSNPTVVTGFCSSFPLAEFPFPLFSVILLRLLRLRYFVKRKKKFLPHPVTVILAYMRTFTSNNSITRKKLQFSTFSLVKK